MTTTTITIDQQQVMWMAKETKDVDQKVRNAMGANTPAILVGAAAPHHIVACNQAWRDLCGFGKEALGQKPSILQGELTDMKKAARFRRDLVGNGTALVTLANYRKSGEMFAHRLHGSKVTSASGAEFYMTKGVEVRDEAIRRAVLKLPEMSLAEQNVAVTLAVLVASFVIASATSATTPGTAMAFGLGAVDAIDLALIQASLQPLAASVLAAVMVVLSTTLTDALATSNDADGLRAPSELSAASFEAIGVASLLGLAFVLLDAPAAIPLALVALHLGRRCLLARPDPIRSDPDARSQHHASARRERQALAEIALVAGLGLWAVCACHWGVGVTVDADRFTEPPSVGLQLQLDQSLFWL